MDLSPMDEPATQPVLKYPVTVMGEKARSSPKTGIADTISLSTALRRMQSSVRCAGTLVSGAGRRSLARLDTGTGSSSIPLV